MDRYLPLHVAKLTPGERKRLRVGLAIAARSAELGPVVGSRCAGEAKAKHQDPRSRIQKRSKPQTPNTCFVHLLPLNFGRFSVDAIVADPPVDAAPIVA